jgi:hypothetical protein
MSSPHWLLEKRSGCYHRNETITSTVSSSLNRIKRAIGHRLKTTPQVRQRLQVRTVRQNADSAVQTKSPVCGKPEMERIATVMFIQ